MLTTRNKIIGGFIFMILLLMVTAGFAYIKLTEIVSDLSSYRIEARTAVSGTAADAHMRDAKDKISNFIITLDSGGTKFMEDARTRLQEAIALTENAKNVEVDSAQIAPLDEAIKNMKSMAEETKSIEQKLLDADKSVRGYLAQRGADLNNELTEVNTAARLAANNKLLPLVDDAYSAYSDLSTAVRVYNSNYLPEDGVTSFDLIKKFKEVGPKMSSVAGNNDEHSAIAKLNQSAADYYNKFIEVDTAIKDANSSRADLTKTSDSLVLFFDTYTKKAQDNMNALGPKMQDAAEHSKQLTTIIALVGIAIGAGFAIWIILGVVRVLSSVSIFSNKVAKGDFNAKIDVREGGEIGHMVQAIMAIPTTLKAMTDEYATLGHNIEQGYFDSKGDSDKFSGDFASLMNGTNNLLSRFLTVIENIPMPIAALTSECEVNYLNPAGRSLTGDDYRQKTCSTLFNRDDSGTPADGVKKALATLAPASGETRVHPGGRDIDVTYSSIPVLNNEGKFAYLIQIMADVTSIKKTQRTIMDVANQANEISNRVAVAAEELSSQVEEVSRGTDIQRDRVASTATAMEEMNATVLEVAKNAGEASEQADGTSSKAQYGVDMVNKLIHSINQVNNVAGELSQNMHALGEQAEAIGGVMEVISDIADQTNLLALNAAIEAARAGEAGRGFAVVADEVRKLAEKTMSATSEVGSSIKGIQTSTTTNIARVEEATKAVNDATGLANTSGEALQEILQLVANNSAVISGIATAAEEQSATSEEINRSVEEVNRIAMETASGMAESSAAVQELSEQAQQLRTLLDRLRNQ